MGGGTLLIPLLTIFLSVEQKVAQGINLLAFLPMAIVALIIHFKNKMVETKGILWIIIPGILSSVGFAFLASMLDNSVLRTLFGSYLILIAIYEICCLFTEKNWVNIALQIIFSMLKSSCLYKGDFLWLTRKNVFHVEHALTYVQLMQFRGVMTEKPKLTKQSA